ncbi:MAG: bacteriohemerythrin [Candidatus Thiodiazotropha sp.]
MPKLEDFQAIEWDPSMATGIADIDKQHQYLVDTLQEANRRLLADDDAGHMKKVVKGLLGYAIMHFETEESLMQVYGYAAAHPEDAKAHIAQHRDFSSRIVAINEQLREGRAISRIEVLLFLNNWLREHVLGIDQLLGRFLFHKMKQSGNRSRC